MKTNFLKLGVAATALLAFSFGNAQQTTGDVAQQTGVDYGTTTTGGSIRVIDNKGTIKYLQVQNGLTQLTNTTAGITTTTWQLGGTLTDNTIIDLDGNEFTLDGIAVALENIATTTVAAATATTAVSGTETGYTILVRNEATGNIEKLLATSLVESGNVESTAGADTLTGTFDIAVAGMPVSPSVVWVYRNGAKLLASEYDATVAGTVTVTVNPGTGAPNWVSFTGDVYEVYWVK
jgi:hypothetical protein